MTRISLDERLNLLKPVCPEKPRLLMDMSVRTYAEALRRSCPNSNRLIYGLYSHRKRVGLHFDMLLTEAIYEAAQNCGDIADPIAYDLLIAPYLHKEMSQ